MIEEKVLKTIHRYNLIENGDTIVIGVSGGPDSMCLLQMLNFFKEEKRWNISLVVAHINHGMRKEAIEDQCYVEEYCKKQQIPCFVKQVQIQEIAKKEKIGVEEAGRKVRYAFFEEVAKEQRANKIATAHTAKDNAETVLMHLMRGSGTLGLTGIKAIQTNYIRPLIACSREEIEDYCQTQGLEPKQDKTNFDNKYTRNKIRNELIPYIQKEFNPNIVETVNRLADIINQENEYLQMQTKQAYQNVLIQEQEEQIQLDLKKFNQLHLVIKNRIVLDTIKNLFGTSSGIEKIHIHDIITLCGNNIGNKFLIPNKKVKVLVKDKKIFFIKNKEIP